MGRVAFPGIKMPQVTRVLSWNHSADVYALREIVQEAWIACLQEYLQIVTMRLVDAQYSRQFFNSTFHDSYEFYYFAQELNDPKFSNSQVWRAWRYIRPLVTKYVPESEDKLLGTIRDLDHGYDCDLFAILFRLSLILG